MEPSYSAPWKRVLRSASAGAALMALGGAVSAVPVEINLDYHCYYEIIGWQPMTVNVASEMPESVPVGEFTPEFNIEATSTVKGQTWTGLASILRASSLEGTASAASHVGGPNFDFPLHVDMAIPRQNVPEEDPGEAGFQLAGINGVTPPIRFREENLGTMTIDVRDRVNPRDGYTPEELQNLFPEDVSERDLELEVIARRADGSVIVQAPITDSEGVIHAPCVLTPPDQDSVLHTFEVTDGGGDPLPDIAVSSEALDFGQVDLGVTASDTLTVSNNGEAALTVDSVTLGGDAVADFTQSNHCTTVAAGDSCAVEITFTPGAEGVRAASLTITSNDPDTGTLAVPLEGRGMAVATPALSVSPGELSFGDVEIGAGKDLTLTLTNDGNADLALNGLSVDTGPFTVVDDCGAALAPEGDCTATVTFEPLTQGTLSATLTIASNDPDAPHNVALDGQGIAEPVPVVDVAPVDLDFGQVQAGVGKMMPVTVSNNGTADLTIGDLAVGGTHAEAFAFSSECATVAPGADCAIEVHLSSSREGVKAGTLTITSNDPESPTVAIALSGEVTPLPQPDIAVQPRDVAFGDVPVGDSQERTVTVTNNGNADLSVETITLEEGAFSQSHDCDAPLAPGTDCTLTLVFQPGEAGAQSVTLTITSDDPDTGALTVSLNGTGVIAAEPGLSLDTDEIVFGDTVTGETRDRAITLTNTGSAVLNVNAVRLEGGDQAFAQDNDCGALQPDASCRITVSFSPAVEGEHAGTLTIESNDPDGPLAVPLVGTGTAVATAEVTVAPKKLNFGATAPGNTRNRDLVIKNTSSADLTLEIAIEGDNADAFGRLDGGECDGLTPDATCTLTVSFKPASLGQQDAALVIKAAGLEQATEVPLSGRGVENAGGGHRPEDDDDDDGVLGIGGTTPLMLGLLLLLVGRLTRGRHQR